MQLTKLEKRQFEQRGFSRRSFGRLATLLAAGSSLPFYNEPALAQFSKIENAPPDAVMINANENPLGPCPEAREAVANIISQGGRYLFGETDRLAALLAQQEQLKVNYVRIYAGSSAPLHQAVLAFTSPNKAFVTADPGYEAGERAARFIGARVVRVPLTKDYAHDVKAMAAVADAGLIYVCNPNNPTGTLTPKADIEWLVANKPNGAVVMIDEAYTHIAGAPFNTDLVAADKDVIVLRTFSKIYGMAGLRAGAALARPDLLEKLAGFQRRDDADHRNGGGLGQPGIENRGAGAAQEDRRRAFRRLLVSRSAQVPIRAFGFQLFHGRCQASRAATSSWRCAKRRSTSGGFGRVGPRTCA